MKWQVRTRLVNMNQKSKLVFENNLHYILKNDYKNAKKYVPDPEEYDLKNSYW